MAKSNAQSKCLVNVSFSSLPEYDGTFNLINANGFDRISHGFGLSLILTSNHPNIDIEALIGQPVVMSLTLQSDKKEFCHGVISSFTQFACNQSLYYFKVDVCHWFSRLQDSVSCQTFKNKTVVEIFSEVCKALGFDDFDCHGLLGSYPKIKYVCQLNQSAYEFLSNLLHQYNIGYYFKHTKTKHIMCLVDSVSKLKPCDGSFRLCSYDSDGESFVSFNKKLVLGDDNLHQHDYVASGNYYLMHAGVKLNLVQHDVDHNYQKDYWIKEVQYKFVDGQFECQVILNDMEKSKFYDKQYQSQHSGCLHNGVVVGNESGAVFSNETGDLKLKYAWDDKHSHKTRSTTWVPVLQQMQGRSWGMTFTPRVDDEVLIGDLVGDSSRPVVIGSVYNGDNLPVFKLPNNQNKLGVVTSVLSSDKLSHQLTFDDTSNNEAVEIISSKDFDSSVSGSQQENIEKNKQDNVSADSKYTVNSLEILSQDTIQFTLSSGCSEFTLESGRIVLTANSIKVL